MIIFLISFETKLTNSFKSATPKSPVLNYQSANYDLINNYLSSIDWNAQISSSTSLQNFYDNFISIILSSIKRFVPSRSTRKRPRKPRHITKLLKQKQNAYKKYKSSKSSSNLYKQKSKECDSAVQDYYNKIELKMCNLPSSKNFYNYVNKKIKSRSTIPPLHDNDKNLKFSDTEKANVFNQFFQKVFTDDNGVNLNLPAKSSVTMESFEITFLDILQAVNDSKDKITRTPELIPTYFIKRTISSLLHPLYMLFNFTLNENVIPSQWKKAIIVPVFKKGNRSKADNYRPISLTSSFCRIFESIIFKKIFKHLQSNHLLTPNQFGFLPRRSACSQLLTCLHQWLISYSSNLTANVIYTDFSKAFDSVSHTKLLEVLISYGINETLVSWLSNFLHNRQQQVAIGEALSSPLSIHSGVPQGSVIGPLLFTIYINDIIDCSTSLQNTGNIMLFADDTKLYSTNTIHLQSTLDSLSKWTESRQLKLAPHKCHTLQICKPSKRSPSQPFSINNTFLPSIDVVKDLGIYISSNLEWTEHTSFIYNQASLISYQILKTFKTNKIHILHKLYITYVRPKVEHDTPVWSPWLKKISS